MDIKRYTCIICPLSCSICLKEDNGKTVEITGFNCKRGEDFAKNEYTNPSRRLTTVVKLENSHNNCLPVISDRDIPKDKIEKALEILRKTIVKAPISKNSIIIENILSTGVNIIAAKTAKERG